ncbi:MAG: hypothetical protein J6V71_03675 [Clostridia bacterium]|nr:hypothetical protein [Clostridia bacterium]
MEFRILTENDKALYKQTIIDAMKESDNDFVPPLSARSSTTQKNLLGGGSSEQGLLSYCNEMLLQIVLGAFEEDELIGFVSFKENYVNDVILDCDCPNIYLSTLILKKQARGKHLTQRMYDYLFNTLYADRSIFTRTWSTNGAHLRILEKFNFNLIKTIPNDRGSGIDTVYFALKR